MTRKEDDDTGPQWSPEGQESGVIGISSSPIEEFPMETSRVQTEPTQPTELQRLESEPYRSQSQNDAGFKIKRKPVSVSRTTSSVTSSSSQTESTEPPPYAGSAMVTGKDDVDPQTAYY